MNALPPLGIHVLLGQSILKGKETTCPSDNCIEVRLVQTAVIPGRGALFVEAELKSPRPEEDGDLLFEPHMDVLGGMGLQAPEALVRVRGDGRIWVHLGNSQSLARRVEVGQILGTVAPSIEPELGPAPADSLGVSAPTYVFSGSSQDSPGGRKERLLTKIKLPADSLTDSEVLSLQELIKENADIFALTDAELGCTTLVKHCIQTNDHAPIKQGVRRTPFVHRKTISGLIDRMLKQGVIRPSSSPWASPIVLVKKKNGEFRFCVDYRRLNAITRKDVYPLPRIEDILDTLSGTKYFTSLDLAAGYWQIALEENSRSKTAFATHCGLHEFVRMPFGLCNGPATFQRLMEVVLAGLVWKNCYVYLDDILICSRTFTEHLQHLREVFERLREANLHLKPEKCLFVRETVPYLGHVVTKQGISPDPAKTRTVREYPPPSDRTQLRQFLGLASYYRRFVPGFAKIASPLHSLLKKETTFHWSDNCQEAFEVLKERLITTPVLAYPEFGDGHSFVLETDASTQGLGAVLAQKKSDGRVHPIAYASRSLQPHEKNYAITELETLGLVWAVKHFRPYLLGHPCTVYTDHAACTSLLQSRNLSPKLARWAMIIQELDLDIKPTW